MAEDQRFDQSNSDDFQYYSRIPAMPPDGSPRFRRRVHLSTAVGLLLAAPWFVLSLLVVGLIADLASSGNAAVLWAAVGVFVLSGAAAFFGPTEYMIARVMFRYRRPTMQEQYRIDHAWGAVTRSAGVRPDSYRLWVQDSGGLNASATSGHIVAVTRTALDLPPHHLAAVLAHELGHHLGGHSWAALLTNWYAIPGRLIVRVLYWINHFIFAITAGCLIRPIVRLFPVLWYAGITWMLYLIHPALVLVWAIPLLVAWSVRSGERYADRVAADLGYGQPFLEVLYSWLNAGHDEHRRRQGLRANLLASHPSCASRIRALEEYMYGAPRNGDIG
jgi:Zn-dependent protease with chaperone function